MTSAAREFVAVERFDRFARVSLNRPAKRNALNTQLLAEFSESVVELDRDPTVSAIVVRGMGPSFCSGYDISADGDPERSYRRANGDVLADWRAMSANSDRWLGLWHLTTPTIAQVHGYCLAGGAELALMCDLVFAADDAKFGHPVVRDLGVPTVNVYPYLIGLRRAKEMMLTGRAISGTEAAQIGLINRSMPAEQLDSYVLEYATDMVQVPASLLAMNKRVTNDAFSAMGWEVGIRQGAVFDALAHTTTDVKQAMESSANARSVGRARAATTAAAEQRS